MPAHRILFDFRPALNVAATANSQAGWSEVFFREVAEADNVALSKARDLLADRIFTLSTGWRCWRIRASVWPSTRLSAQVGVVPGDGTGSYVADPEQPNDVVVCAVTTAAGRGSSREFRGIGRGVIDAGLQYLAPAEYVGNFKFFRDQLVGDSWCGQVGTLFTPPAGGRAGIPILDVHPVGTFQGLIAQPTRPVLLFPRNTWFGIPLVAGDAVKISGVTEMTGINGIWHVLVPAVQDAAFDYVQLRDKRNVKVGGVFGETGRMWRIDYTLSAITEISPVRGSGKKVGGTSGRPRGRRRRPA